MVSPSSVDTVNVGTLFANRYELISVLGQGAMGKVFAARDTMLSGTVVALKILNSQLSQDEAHLQRFLREVQLTRTIAHPNVVRTFDVGTVDNLPYFTMELVEGRTLEEAIKCDDMTLEGAIQTLKAIAEALEAIHQSEIIHRDLKPANIILPKTGGIKLMDFGIARPQVSKLTATDELVGSASHMAPEIWKQSETTKKVDIYSFGIVAYELLTGILPFDGATAYEIMWKHLRQDFVPVREHEPAVPAWLAELVSEMLQKEPKDRPASAQEIVRRLTMQDLSEGTPKEVISRDAATGQGVVPAGAINPFRTMLSRNALHSVRKGLKKPTEGKNLKPQVRKKKKILLKAFLILITMLAVGAGIYGYYHGRLTQIPSVSWLKFVAK